MGCNFNLNPATLAGGSLPGEGWDGGAEQLEHQRGRVFCSAPVAGATVRRKSKQRTASFSDLSDFSKSPTLKCLFPRVVVGVGRRFNNNDCLYLKHYKLKGGRSFSI